MKTLNVSQARQQLPQLVAKIVALGEEILVTKRGKPVIKLVPCKNQDKRKQKYPLRGLTLWMSDDFDQPLLDWWESLAQ